LLQLLKLTRAFLEAVRALKKSPLSAIKVILSKVLPTADPAIFARCQSAAIEYFLDYSDETEFDWFSICCFLSDGLDVRFLPDDAAEVGTLAMGKEKGSTGPLAVEILTNACIASWLASGARIGRANSPPAQPPEALMNPMVDRGLTKLMSWLISRFSPSDIRSGVSDVVQRAALRPEATPSPDFITSFLNLLGGMPDYNDATIPGLFLALLTDIHDARSLKDWHAFLCSKSRSPVPQCISCVFCVLDAIVLCAIARGANCLAADPSCTFPEASRRDCFQTLSTYISKQLESTAATAISGQFALVYKRLDSLADPSDADAQEAVRAARDVLDSLVLAQFLSTIVTSQNQTLAMNGAISKCLSPATLHADFIASLKSSSDSSVAVALHRILGLRALQIPALLSALRIMYRACGKAFTKAKIPVCSGIKSVLAATNQFVLTQVSYSRACGEIAAAVLEGTQLRFLHEQADTGCTQLCLAFRARTGVFFPPSCFDWAESRALSLMTHLALFSKDYLYTRYYLDRLRTLSKGIRESLLRSDWAQLQRSRMELLCILASTGISVAISQPQHAWYALQSGTTALAAHSTGDARGWELEGVAEDLCNSCARLDVCTISGMRALSLALLVLAENLACSQGTLYARLVAARERDERIWLLHRALGMQAGHLSGALARRKEQAGLPWPARVFNLSEVDSSQKWDPNLAKAAAQVVLLVQEHDGTDSGGRHAGLSTAAAAATLINLAQVLIKASHLSSNLTLFRRVKLIEISLLPAASERVHTFLQYEKEEDVRWLVESLVKLGVRPPAGRRDTSIEMPESFSPATSSISHPMVRLPRHTILDLVAKRDPEESVRPKDLCVFPPPGMIGEGTEIIGYNTVSMSLSCEVFSSDIVKRFLLGVFDADEPPFSEEEADEFVMSIKEYYQGKCLYLDVAGGSSSSSSSNSSSSPSETGDMVFSIPLRNKGQDRDTLMRAGQKLRDLDDSMREAVGACLCGPGGSRFAQAIEFLLDADCILPAAFLAMNRAMRCLRDFSELSRPPCDMGERGAPRISEESLARLLAAADKCVEIVCEKLLPAAVDPFQGVFSEVVGEDVCQRVQRIVHTLESLASSIGLGFRTRESAQRFEKWANAFLLPSGSSGPSVLSALKFIASVLGDPESYIAVVSTSRESPASGGARDEALVDAFRGSLATRMPVPDKRALSNQVNSLLANLREPAIGSQKPVLLGLDSALFRMPVEACPMLRGLDVTRRLDYPTSENGHSGSPEEAPGEIHSNELVEDPGEVQARISEPHTHSLGSFQEEQDDSVSSDEQYDAYLIDPGGTLPQAQKEFKEVFSTLPGRWKGDIGANGPIPPKELLKGVSGVRRKHTPATGEVNRGEGEESQDIPQNALLLANSVARLSSLSGPRVRAGPGGDFPVYFYAGHNAGEFSIPLNFVSSLRSLPLCIVIGCSSMSVVPVGDSLALGACQYYRSAPCVIGCLWDALGKELDSASRLLLVRWTQGGRTISECLREARASCRLPHLVGSCLVLFGDPEVVYTGREE